MFDSKVISFFFGLALASKVVIIFGKTAKNQSPMENQTDSDFIPPEIAKLSQMDTDELIEYYGYPAETHFVVTEDGYILRLHRIPQPNGQPFYLQHGLYDTSMGYVMMGPKIGLGFFLYDSGFDVWLGNSRGNFYSRNHTKLDPDKDSNFWEFSFHEHGVYDVPAAIDFILAKSQFKKVGYVGHSLGGSIFAAMLSKRPEYNKKILMVHALSPSGFMKNFPFKATQLVSSYALVLKRAATMMGIKELLPRKFLLPDICLLSVASVKMCSICLELIVGPLRDQFNETMAPLIVNNYPAGSSPQMMVHMGQLISSGRFCEYDYGITGNLLRYKSTTPPDYDLSKITAPVFLYYGLNDNLVSHLDVKELERQLANHYRTTEMKEYNHIDFVWGIDVQRNFYKPVLMNFINKFMAGNLKRNNKKI